MIEASPKKIIIFKFLIWHFFEVPKNLLKVLRNFLVFNFNYFSIPLLLKTFFAHWKKYREFYGRGFDPKRYARVFASNITSRVLGAIIRFFIIIIGLVSEIFIFISGILIFLIWLVLPILLIFLFYLGIDLLIN